MELGSHIGEIRDASEGVKISEGTRVWELQPGGWKHFEDCRFRLLIADL